MIKEISKYSIVDPESRIIEENLSLEDARIMFDFLFFARGIINLKIEEYFPGHLMGRDADLH